MLNTLTSATFRYKNRLVTARRMVDTFNGTFFCWQGFIDDNYQWSVADRSLQKFEKKFQELVDHIEKERPVPF